MYKKIGVNMEMSSNAIFNWLIYGIFCEGVYFIRIEFNLVRKRADGSEKYGLGDLNEETRASKCS